MANSATTDKSKSENTTMEKVQLVRMQVQELLGRYNREILVVIAVAVGIKFEQSITIASLITETHPAIALACVTTGFIGYRINR